MRLSLAPPQTAPQHPPPGSSLKWGIRWGIRHNILAIGFRDGSTQEAQLRLLRLLFSSIGTRRAAGQESFVPLGGPSPKNFSNIDGLCQPTEVDPSIAERRNRLAPLPRLLLRFHAAQSGQTSQKPLVFSCTSASLCFRHRTEFDCEIIKALTGVSTKRSPQHDLRRLYGAHETSCFNYIDRRSIVLAVTKVTNSASNLIAYEYKRR